MDSGPSATRAGSSPSHPLDVGGFAPGRILADRYRIVALVGRGGMGEVYRADDLKLGQPVALKFLPPGLERDPAARDRLLAEVRSARTVSHPNVCRVYDVGEVGGRVFLTMEYIDGEDLGSLLRRIGKLPAAKALEVARQLCAGLAAAHDKGVLHRDLKPANVMIDGRGQARITDFGLAVNTQAGGSPADFAGTLPYMAPERFHGTPASVQSDLYGLGLILYETYTGKPAFKASSLQEWERVHADSTPSNPSALTSEIEPAVDRAIMRCLAKEPARRPASAAQVAAGLPGGDPLAAAIAAGETPSPELVAASGEEGTLPRAKAWLWLAACLAALLAVPFSLLPFSLIEHIPFELGSDTLQVRARDLVQSLGYRDVPADSTWWFATDDHYLDRVNRMRPNEATAELKVATPGPMRFCYRQSASTLSSWVSQGVQPPKQDNPPPLPGDVYVETDLSGRLLLLRVTPLPSDGPTPPGGVTWAPLLSAAQMGPIEGFAPAQPRWWPETGVDAREARAGMYGGHEVRLEAAARDGLPVLFRVVMPWHSPLGAISPAESTTARARLNVYWFFQAVLWTCLVVFATLARRNVRLRRGDHVSARRLGVVVGTGTFVWLVIGGLPPARSLILMLAISMGAGLVIWMVYLGLEPAVRRTWPQLLVTWTRLLNGQYRDPLVGRALLAGALCGSLYRMPGTQPIYRLLDLPGGGATEWTGALDGVLNFAGRIAAAPVDALAPTVFELGILLILRLALRRQSLAWIGLGLLEVAFNYFQSRSYRPTTLHPGVLLAFAFVFAALTVWVLWKHGALALGTMMLVNQVELVAPWTLDLSRWYAWRQFFVMAIVAAIAVWGFRNVLGRQSAFAAQELDA